MSELVPSYVHGSRAYPNMARVESLVANNLGIPRVAAEGGKYLQFTREGMTFIARSHAAAAIPLSATTGVCPTLWNPEGSGKILVPLKIMLSLAAIGTPAVWGLALAQTLATGVSDNIGSGKPIVTFTNRAPKTARIGGPAAVAKGMFASDVVTFTAAPTVIMDLGMGGWKDGTAANSNPVAGLEFDLDGLIMMAPGSAISLVGTVASSTTFFASILFAELPEFPL